MRPKNTVISLPVSNIPASLEFYKSVVQIDIASVDEKIISIELPKLSLFLIEQQEFNSYSKIAGVSALNHAQNTNQIEVILSCAFSTKQEILEIQNRLSEAGYQFNVSESNNEDSFMGYFRDLDGHLWELVWNQVTAKA